MFNVNARAENMPVFRSKTLFAMRYTIKTVKSPRMADDDLLTTIRPLAKPGDCFVSASHDIEAADIAAYLANPGI